MCQKVDKISSNDNIDNIPDRPAQRQRHKWLEQQCQGAEKNHPIRIMGLILEVSGIPETYECHETHNLVEPIRHIRQAEEQKNSKRRKDDGLYFGIVFSHGIVGNGNLQKRQDLNAPAA